MINYDVTKVNGDPQPANEMNNMFAELLSVVTSTGDTPSGSGSVIQLAEAIAALVAVGLYYAESGAADAYVLSVSPATRKAPDAYYTGMIVKFIAGNINTGASTVNVAGLGSKSIKRADGTTALSAGEIKDEGLTTLYYDGTNFLLQQSGVNQGICVQKTYTEVSAVDTTTTTIPLDNTAPATSEGKLAITNSHTPKNASHLLLVEGLLSVGHSVAGATVIGVIFQDGTGIVAMGQGQGEGAGTLPNIIPIRKWVVAGGTSAISFTAYYGSSSAGTSTLNGINGVGLFNGLNVSSLSVKEYSI